MNEMSVYLLNSVNRCVNSITKHRFNEKYIIMCSIVLSRRLSLSLLSTQHNYCSKVSLIKQNHSLNSNQSINSIQSKHFSLNSQTSHNCWKCNQLLIDSKPLLFCCNCSSIQSIDSNLNYFKLFQQNVSFDINLLDLTKRFRTLQMSTHPDRYATKSEREHRYSLDNSSFINKAYKTLGNPYERGLYLLELFDNPMQENDTGMDSKFLTDIMKLNEDIEENKNSVIKLSNIFKENKLNIETITNQISDAFSSHDIIKAKQLLAKFKFYITLDLNLKQRLQDLE